MTDETYFNLCKRLDAEIADAQLKGIEPVLVISKAEKDLLSKEAKYPADGEPIDIPGYKYKGIPVTVRDEPVYIKVINTDAVEDFVRDNPHLCSSNIESLQGKKSDKPTNQDEPISVPVVNTEELGDEPLKENLECRGCPLAHFCGETYRDYLHGPPTDDDLYPRAFISRPGSKCPMLGTWDDDLEDRVLACVSALEGVSTKDLKGIAPGWKFLLILPPDHSRSPELMDEIVKALNTLVGDKDESLKYKPEPGDIGDLRTREIVSAGDPVSSIRRHPNEDL